MEVISSNDAFLIIDQQYALHCQKLTGQLTAKHGLLLGIIFVDQSFMQFELKILQKLLFRIFFQSRKYKFLGNSGFYEYILASSLCELDNIECIGRVCGVIGALCADNERHLLVITKWSLVAHYPVTHVFAHIF